MALNYSTSKKVSQSQSLKIFKCLKLLGGNCYYHNTFSSLDRTLSTRRSCYKIHRSTITAKSNRKQYNLCESTGRAEQNRKEHRRPHGTLFQELVISRKKEEKLASNVSTSGIFYTCTHSNFNRTLNLIRLISNFAGLFRGTEAFTHY